MRQIDREGLEDMISPDTIRQPDGRLASALQAGRIVLDRTASCFAAGQGFLLETTVSGNREERVVAEARARGYRVEVLFVCLRDVELNIMRVQSRVLLGGHPVPEVDIRRRYGRSLDNLRAILPLADAAALFDNSGDGHRLVARFSVGQLNWRAADGPAWLGRVLDAV
ncbi:MAG: hypothetical protein JNM66_29470 [Bryobacterales bacterium]|nr:hypothetical protein [Bryobacterales bacterium]